MDWKTITSDELKSLIETNTYVSLGKMFGISDTAVKKKAKKFGIWKRSYIYNGHNEKLRVFYKCVRCGEDRSTKTNLYCSLKCFNEQRYDDYITRWKMGEEDGCKGYGVHTGISNFLRRYIKEKFNNECSICGWNEINPTSGASPLEVEHIDGNATNNEEENLTLLCPNCHSLTPTHGYLNRGNGRGVVGKTKCV